MNNISADATRVTAPPALHWACDSPALPLLAVVPPSRIEPFLFSSLKPFLVQQNVFAGSARYPLTGAFIDLNESSTKLNEQSFT